MIKKKLRYLASLVLFVMCLNVFWANCACAYEDLLNDNSSELSYVLDSDSQNTDTSSFADEAGDCYHSTSHSSGHCCSNHAYINTKGLLALHSNLAESFKNYNDNFVLSYISYGVERPPRSYSLV